MTVDLIRQIMAKIPDKGDIRAKTPNVLHWKVPAGETYSRAECTRGEYGYYMVSDGTEYPRRINVRGPSYTHAVALLEGQALAGEVLLREFVQRSHGRAVGLRVHAHIQRPVGHEREPALRRVELQ